MQLRKQLHEHVINLRAFLHQLKAAARAQAFSLRCKLAAHIERKQVRIKRLRLRARCRRASKARAQLHQRRHQPFARPLCAGRHFPARKGRRKQGAAHSVAQYIKLKRFGILRFHARKASFCHLKHIPLPEGARGGGKRAHHEARRGIARKRVFRIRKKRNIPRPKRTAYGVDVCIQVGSDNSHVAVTDAAVRGFQDRIRNSFRFRRAACRRKQGYGLRRIFPLIGPERVCKRLVFQMAQRRVRAFCRIFMGACNRQAHSPRRAPLFLRNAFQPRQEAAFRLKHHPVSAIRRKIRPEGDRK